MSKSEQLKRNSSDVKSNIRAHTHDTIMMIDGSLDCTITRSKNIRKKKAPLANSKVSQNIYQLSFASLTKKHKLVHDSNSL